MCPKCVTSTKFSRSNGTWNFRISAMMDDWEGVDIYIEPGLPKRGLNGIMRSTIAACAILVLLIGTADAEQCPPGALGVSRTLVVDPSEHSRVGSMQYPETLPLNDHEVVLTFDDGPVPRYTNPVLETLASECVQATFFMVGQMARAQPYRGARQGHLAAARHSPANRPRAARNSQRAQKPRLQDRSCRSGNRRPAENLNLRGAMGSPPHARAAYESTANAPTAPRNISPPWG